MLLYNFTLRRLTEKQQLTEHGIGRLPRQEDGPQNMLYPQDVSLPPSQ